MMRSCSSRISDTGSGRHALTRRCDRSFTLLETLMVVVLLSLAMVLVSGIGLARSSSRDLHGCASSVLDLLESARRQARRDGPLLVRLSADSHRAVVVDRRTGRVLDRVTWSTGIIVEWRSVRTRRTLDTVGFDAAGRSEDVAMRVYTAGDPQGGVLDITVSGLTGWTARTNLREEAPR